MRTLASIILLASISVVGCAPPSLTMNPTDAGGDAVTSTDGTQQDVPSDVAMDVASDVAPAETGMDVQGIDAGMDVSIDVPPGSDCGVAVACGCADLNTDPNHCGSCATACPPAMNAQPSCMGGVCGVRCNAGFGNCDGNASNGCETSLTTLTACGACGVSCPAAPANATEVCAGGSCRFVCSLHYADCDGIASNGCETYTYTDVSNCGSCGHVCPGTDVCRAGVCAICTIHCGTGSCPCDTGCCGTLCC